MVRYLNNRYRWYYNYIPEGINAVRKVSVKIVKLNLNNEAVTWMARESIGDIVKGKVYTSTLGWLFTDETNEESLREVIAENKIKSESIFQSFFLKLNDIFCLL